MQLRFFGEVLMLRVASGIYPAMFFVSSSDALFRFTFVYTAKFKKSDFF